MSIRPSKRFLRLVSSVVLSTTGVGISAEASAQIFINEIVKEERLTPSTGAVTPDKREFIELYNAGATPVDLSNYVLRTTNLNTLTPINDTLPAGATIAPGGYYVIAVEDREVPNADYYIPLGENEDLFPDLIGLAIELRDAGGNLLDAIALDTVVGASSLDNLINQLPDVYARTGRGSWGRVHAYNIEETDDFKRLSYGRYQDGVGANSSGHYFGFLPATPGASNNLPINAAHTVPDVDALAPGSPVVGYNYDIVPVRVIDPGTAALPYNPSAIPPSPQGGRAMTLRDNSGGLAVFSNELVHSFDLYAYLDSTPLDLPGDWEVEWTAYGIGTSDQWFNTPNPFNSIPSNVSTSTLTGNGSTGVGWFYERFQALDGTNAFRLAIIDFGAGGNSVQAAGLWDVKATFDLTPADAGWHRLSIDYDPETGEVVAKFNDETVTFTTTTDLAATFYVGYREGLTGVPPTEATDNVARSRPATWDMIGSLSPTENADFNTDGVVDGADFLVWQRGFGGPGGLPQGDADGNGQVNAADLTIWKDQFGSASAIAATTAIPEPATVGLLLSTVAGWPLFRRKLVA